MKKFMNLAIDIIQIVFMVAIWIALTEIGIDSMFARLVISGVCGELYSNSAKTFVSTKGWY